MRIAIIAGEASGDLLGGGLIEALRRIFPDAEFEGMAGPRMIGQGCKALHHIDELSVMGFTEVLRQLPRLLRLRSQLADHFINNPPDVLIGIDAPDFNLGLERRVRARGIPTVHYVSPSVWAWRQGRIKGIARSVDLMLALLPFEVDFYRRHSVPVEFVGHPLADEIPLWVDRAQQRKELGLEVERQVLALLPGSRSSEVTQLIGPFLAAAIQCGNAMPGLLCLIPSANQRTRLLIEEAVATAEIGKLDVRIMDGRSHDVMAAADVVLLASGTATLEATLLHRPMVMGYRVSAISYWIYRAFGLNKSNLYTLPNLLSGSRLVPEYIQDDVRPDKLAAEVLNLFEDESARKSQIERFKAIHQTLRRSASEMAAQAIARLLKERRS